MKVNHYKWLEKHLPDFFRKVGVNWNNNCGIITAHGDKCYSYRTTFEKAGISFPHGVAIYLLTYCNPFADEVRETKNGWVAPIDWIVENKNRFLPLLTPIDKNDKDVTDNY